MNHGAEVDEASLHISYYVLFMQPEDFGSLYLKPLVAVVVLQCAAD